MALRVTTERQMDTETIRVGESRLSLRCELEKRWFANPAYYVRRPTCDRRTQ